MHRSRLLAAVVLAAVAAVTAPAVAQQTDEVVVPVTGEAVIRGDSLLAASSAAKLNGYREALRMQLHRLLDTLGANEAFPRLRSRARTYVKAEQIEDEEREADTRAPGSRNSGRTYGSNAESGMDGARPVMALGGATVEETWRGLGT